MLFATTPSYNPLRKKRKNAITLSERARTPAQAGLALIFTKVLFFIVALRFPRYKKKSGAANTCTSGQHRCRTVPVAPRRITSAGPLPATNRNAPDTPAAFPTAPIGT